MVFTQEDPLGTAKTLGEVGEELAAHLASYAMGASDAGNREVAR